MYVQDGKTALIWLTSAGDKDFVEAIEILIDAGAEVADTANVRLGCLPSVCNMCGSYLMSGWDLLLAKTY